MRELTDGNGANRIIEVGGPGTFGQSVKAVSLSGQVSMVGALAGFKGTVDFMSLFLSRARYQPIAVGSRQDLQDLVEFAATHKIAPIIDSRYAFDDAKRAFERMVTRNIFGKIVIAH